MSESTKEESPVEGTAYPPRSDRRSDEALRPISVETGVQRFCAGSALIRWGETHVLCSASWDGEAPPYAADGWLSAEYSLLPGSTQRRVRRERKGPKGRTAEIQRLIGRSLRAAIPAGLLEGKMLQIDCDVIQADGGTRCAAITGGWIALAIALRERWSELLPVAALSFGIEGERLLSDLCYEEDAQVDVDLNLILAPAGIVEVQGCAERGLFTGAQLNEALRRGERATATLFEVQRSAVRAALSAPPYLDAERPSIIPVAESGGTP